MYAEHMMVGEEGRPAPGGRQIAILMPPGNYTVRLIVDDETHEQPLTVIKDPHSAGSEADITAQVAFLKGVREDVVRAGEAVHRVEAMRVQLATVKRFTDDPAVVESIEGVEDKLVEMQMEMVDLRLTGQGQDGVRFGAPLLQKLGYVSGGISVADFPPTNQEGEVKVLLNGMLNEYIERLDEYVSDEVNELNQMLRARGLVIISDSPDR
tara:strand:- start:67 stop:696 length:630 start_codon:yes stop_codon:yes gene_type:complete